MNTDSSTSDAAAKRNGLSKLDRIRELRAQFGLSMTEAKDVTDATDGIPPLFPHISNGKELTAVLKSEFGYCTCASGAAIEVMKNLLRLTQERTDATGDVEAFASFSRKTEALLSEGGGWAEWLVYSLDLHDFIQHGFRQSDLLITEKGRLLLKAIEQFTPE